MVNVLFAFMNGRFVGELRREIGGDLSFVYDDAWLEATDVHRSLSLSLRLQTKEHRGGAVRNFFVNLLPDNPNVVAAIANRLELRSTDVFDVLRAIGADCVGALELLPDKRPHSSEDRQTYRSMTDSEIEELLGQLNAFPLGMSEHDDFRLSIAGAQQKTALTKLPDIGWVLPSGTMPTTHIFKTPIGSLLANSIHFDESCENEWLCLEIARAFGLPAANADILTFGCRTAIVVERFDRAISRRQNDHLLRIPTEDFCQVFGISPEKKYEADGGPGIRDIMDVLKWSADADGDRRRFMAAQVLLWLLDSTDGHAKNYSVFLEAKDRFRLTPLYDILSAAPLAATGELSSRRLKLAMGLIGKNRHYRMTDIEPRHFLSTAAAVDYPKAEMLAVLNHFARLTPEVVAKVRNKLPSGFPETTASPMFEVLQKRAGKIAAFLQTQT